MYRLRDKAVMFWNANDIKTDEEKGEVFHYLWDAWGWIKNHS
jgi:hypothetical protein